MASDLKQVNHGWEIRIKPDVDIEDDQLEFQMLIAYIEAFELWCKKQRDYGAQNIAQAGEAGVALRANDKVQRLLTLLSPGAMIAIQGKVTAERASQAVNEPIRDSWLDLINYAAMGLLLRDGVWPEPEALSARPGKCRHCGREL